MAYSPMTAVVSALNSIQDYVSRLGFLAEARAPTWELKVVLWANPTVSIASAQTLATVTTVTTLTNQSQIGWIQAQNQIPALMNMEATIWNIDNIYIS